jgi:hypothetical protein
MSNTHSKQKQMIGHDLDFNGDASENGYDQDNDYERDHDHDYDYDYEYKCVDDLFYSDKLILKLEEIDEESDSVKLTCYVAYDHNEEEYFICGKRISDKEEGEEGEEGDFKFYCKTRKNTMYFLKYLFSSPDETGNMNHVLYNYKYLEDHECVDYWVLNEQEDSRCELSGYDGARYSKSWLSPLLKTLKYVRY